MSDVNDTIEQWEQEIAEQAELEQEEEEDLNDHHGEPAFIHKVNLEIFGYDNIDERSLMLQGIKNKKSYTSFTISIWGGEFPGNPHFHLCSDDNDIKITEKKGRVRAKRFDSCVKLHRPRFYPHAQHTDTFAKLTDGDPELAAKSLNNYLCSPDDTGRTKRQMWAILVEEYFAVNPNLKDVHGLFHMNKPNYNECIDGDENDKQKS